MEDLLHYCWKHKLGALAQLHTVDGEPVEVISPGLHNRHAGPDFLNAKVRIGGTLWVGSVEIHVKASDWFRHRHDTDASYGRVILHVVADSDVRIPYPGSSDEQIPQLAWHIPPYVEENYKTLSRADAFPACRSVVGALPRLRVSSWLSALSVERLQERERQIMQRLAECGHNWEDALFVTLARYFGFGVNSDAFEIWARHIPLSAVGKHRDDLQQVEAIFFGQAGMLATSPFEAAKYKRQGDDSEERAYFDRMRREYEYLRHKFSLEPMDASLWRFLRMRPQNFPTVRIAQLAMLYHEGRVTLSRLLETPTVERLREVLQVHVSDFWTRHYVFTSSPSSFSERPLSVSSLNLLLINAVAPFVFAYGRYRGDESLSQRALNMLEDLPPESNHYITAWKAAGITCRSALDSQALLQLTHRYCDPHDCLRCRFGYEYIRSTPTFLCEED